jgi:hypothetical protein
VTVLFPGTDGTFHVLVELAARDCGAAPTLANVRGSTTLENAMLFMLVTAAGPVVGAVGYFAGVPILFWVGVGIAGINLFMNLASGAMKLPILPAICVVIGAALASPWFVGASLGLLVYTAIESAGEIVTVVKRS